MYVQVDLVETGCNRYSFLFTRLTFNIKTALNLMQKQDYLYICINLKVYR